MVANTRSINITAISLVLFFLFSTAGATYHYQSESDINASSVEHITAYKVPITTKPSKIIKFKKYKAYFDGNETVVRGKLSIQNDVNFLAGVVDAKLYNRHNELVSKIQSPVIFYASSQGNRTYPRFIVRLPNQPLQKSRVVVAFQRLN